MKKLLVTIGAAALLLIAQAPPAHAASTIGLFYDGGSLNGSYLNVTGSACNGGGLNVSTAWNDRISSMIVWCTVVLYEHTNYTGATYTCYRNNGGNPCQLGGTYMDNRTSSIRFF